MKFKPRSVMKRPFAKEKTFAGIGNRDAPGDALATCAAISAILAEAGYVLRTGGAPGCDQAFLSTATMHAEIYVPWHNFEGFPLWWEIPNAAYELAAKYLPYLRTTQKKGLPPLHARNMMQVLGPDLKTKSDFVICYTENGRQENHEGYTHTCGTDSAITCARDHGIPVINIRNPGWSELLSAITGLNFLHLETP